MEAGSERKPASFLRHLWNLFDGCIELLRLNQFHLYRVRQRFKVVLVRGEQFLGSGLLCRYGVEKIVDASASNTPLPGQSQGSKDLPGRQVHEIQVLSQVRHHLSRSVGLQAYGQIAARQSGEDLGQSVCPGNAALLAQPRSQCEVRRCRDQSGGVPVCLYRASRSARITAVMV